MLQVSLSFLAWFMILAFVACEVGDRVSSNLWEINDATDEFDWYSYPIDIQRILPMILMSVQKPVDIECFGSFKTNRESFKKVYSNRKVLLEIYRFKFKFGNFTDFSFCNFVLYGVS